MRNKIRRKKIRIKKSHPIKGNIKKEMISNITIRVDEIRFKKFLKDNTTKNKAIPNTAHLKASRHDAN